MAHRGNTSSSFLYYLEDLAFPGVHLLFFVAVLLLVLSSSLYLSYSSLLDDFSSTFRLLLITCPILLLLLLHLLSSSDDLLVHLPSLLSLPDKDSLHRAGGSPWGVAVVLVLLLFMVSHRSALLERWFPLLAGR
ncbi:hypothetical protein MLD38_004233 [Melastoma candidum]|uniref:Uncharacterized protein n=1 Tax=Melastoma candidum TaxID=119954 RepID=A0ACB9S6K2_9MYRT|nr:hypothetical protein MLD38_004233 [Melastoma candidum]